jgi:excisionase family DNA binding protein
VSREPFLEAAAVVTGWPAWTLARLLPDQEAADRLARVGIRGDHAAAVLATLAAIRRAGDTWHAAATAAGSAEAPEPPAPAPSAQEVVTVDQAATALGVTPRRVRQLIAADDLPARRVGTAWHLDPGDVAALAQTRRDAA